MDENQIPPPVQPNLDGGSLESTPLHRGVFVAFVAVLLFVAPLLYTFLYSHILSVFEDIRFFVQQGYGTELGLGLLVIGPLIYGLYILVVGGLCVGVWFLFKKRPHKKVTPYALTLTISVFIWFLLFVSWNFPYVLAKPIPLKYWSGLPANIQECRLANGQLLLSTRSGILLEAWCIRGEKMLQYSLTDENVIALVEENGFFKLPDGRFGSAPVFIEPDATKVIIAIKDLNMPRTSIPIKAIFPPGATDKSISFDGKGWISDGGSLYNPMVSIHDNKDGTAELIIDSTYLGVGYTGKVTLYAGPPTKGFFPDLTKGFSPRSKASGGLECVGNCGLGLRDLNTIELSFTIR